jgi:hypothetical protein
LRNGLPGPPLPLSNTEPWFRARSIMNSDFGIWTSLVTLFVLRCPVSGLYGTFFADEEHESVQIHETALVMY